MLGLAEADGPAGSATGTLLAHTLANQDQDERAKAVEALLVLAARDALPAAETGTALGRLCALGRIPLPAPSRPSRPPPTRAPTPTCGRSWPRPSRTSSRAGRTRTGRPPVLITLATRLAEVTGAKGAIPEVADVAARGGSSRLVKESARLHRTLTAT